MSVQSLKDKMREFTEGHASSVSVGPSDLKSSDAKSSGPVSGTVTTKVPEEARNDKFMEAGGNASSAHEALVQTTSFIDEVKVTDDDRNAFLEAITTGGRYERQFSLFNGRLTGTFRCRSVGESDGIIAWVGHLANKGMLASNFEYTSLIRNATLAAQVKSLRGLVNEDFPELDGPLAPTRAGKDGDVTPPGWIDAAAAWGHRPEALTSALHTELQKFERVYWTMVVNAADQNFWNPAASI